MNCCRNNQQKLQIGLRRSTVEKNNTDFFYLTVLRDGITSTTDNSKEMKHFCFYYVISEYSRYSNMSGEGKWSFKRIPPFLGFSRTALRKALKR